MKKIISFLSLLLCCPLVACDHYTTAGITYVMEEEKPLAYPNNHYLPLLDIIQQFKDFNEEELVTKENPYISKEEEELAAKQWEKANTMFNQITICFITDLEGHVLDLLNATTNINDCLAKLASIQDYLFSFSIQADTQYLMRNITDAGGVSFPMSKKLFHFLMEDKEVFGGYEDRNERTRLRAVMRFELLNQLIQTAIDLIDRKDLNEKSISLLDKVQAIAACEHPDAAGGPYALLERLIAGGGLSRKNIAWN
jgi:hypothetical protein